MSDESTGKKVDTLPFAILLTIIFFLIGAAIFGAGLLSESQQGCPGQGVQISNGIEHPITVTVSSETRGGKIIFRRTVDLKASDRQGELYPSKTLRGVFYDPNAESGSIYLDLDVTYNNTTLERAKEVHPAFWDAHVTVSDISIAVIADC